MDASYTGNKIAEYRKRQGLTQKELADKLHVTDKAVSKWERGLNFPDISMIEEIAEVLQISVLELLGIKSSSQEQIVSDMAALAHNEQKSIGRDIFWRGWLTVRLGILVRCGQLYASKVLADNGLYGMPITATTGLLPLMGFVVGNGLNSIFKGIKLMK